MKTIIGVTAFCLMCLSACSPATTPPAVSNSTAIPAAVVSSASDSSSDSDMPSADQVLGLKASRAEEATAIKAAPGIASRDGNVLTILAGGKPVARFTDNGFTHCEGYDTCSLWSFEGSITLAGPSGTKVIYADVVQENGEIARNVLVAPDGTTTWFVSNILPSPDGHYLAAGDTSDVESDGSFEITDWTSAGHSTKLTFDAECEPRHWLSATRLSLFCSRNDSDQYTLATVSQVNATTWRLTETDEVTENEKPVMASTLKLKAVDAVPTVNKPQTAKEVADSAAYDKTAGYERLTQP